MREIKTKNVDIQAMDKIAKMYDRLKMICQNTARRVRPGNVVDFDDIFHDCLLTAAQDSTVVNMTDDELARLVAYKFNMIVFMRTKETETERKLITNYANNQVAKRRQEEVKH